MGMASFAGREVQSDEMGSASLSPRCRISQSSRRGGPDRSGLRTCEVLVTPCWFRHSRILSLCRACVRVGCRDDGCMNLLLRNLMARSRAMPLFFISPAPLFCMAWCGGPVVCSTVLHPLDLLSHLLSTQAPHPSAVSKSFYLSAIFSSSSFFCSSFYESGSALWGERMLDWASYRFQSPSKSIWASFFRIPALQGCFYSLNGVLSHLEAERIRSGEDGGLFASSCLINTGDRFSLLRVDMEEILDELLYLSTS